MLKLSEKLVGIPRCVSPAFQQHAIAIHSRFMLDIVHRHTFMNLTTQLNDVINYHIILLRGFLLCPDYRKSIEEVKEDNARKQAPSFNE